MLRPGYGIEYDYVTPTQLEPWMETKAVKGLFCSGQICGTSGYEEAAVQGFMAGVNAALSVLGRDPLVLGRDKAYIGVLIDDLTTRGTDEPYRMIPSRCEHRLVMRHDNADERLCPIGRELGLIDDSKWEVFSKNRASMASVRGKLSKTRVRASDDINAVLAELGSSPITEPVTALELLRRPEISWSVLSRIADVEIDGDLGRRIEIDAKYEGYAEREFRRVRRMTSMERLAIPEDMIYSGITGLSAESAEKLSRISPRTLGQASRIPGVNNVDVQLLQL